MHPYIRRWKEDVVSRTSVAPLSTGTFSGRCHRPQAETSRYAHITVEVQPSAEFAVDTSPVAELVEQDARVQRYVDEAILGLLDVLMVENLAPVTKLSIRLVELRIDPDWSTRATFRWAGRDAAKNILSGRTAS